MARFEESDGEDSLFDRDDVEPTIPCFEKSKSIPSAQLIKPTSTKSRRPDKGKLAEL